MITFVKLSTLTALLFSIATTAVQAGVIFPQGSTWKYFIGTTTAPTTPAWRTTNFNDSAWQGPTPTPIGYGEPDIITAIPSSGTAPTYTTVYFRKTFVIADPADVSQLDLAIRIDDGYVAWINGTEIGRFNVPGGDLAFNAAAPVAGEPADAPITITANLSTLLVPGTNILAIHVLNQSTTSSDLYLDASLRTRPPDSAPPTITSVTPPGGSSITSLTEVMVRFNEEVQGVDAGDLLVNGIPAAVVSGSSSNYTFNFAQPAFGNVQFSWSTDHNITDFGSPAVNLFDGAAPGATWQYTLLDTVRPTVAGLVPEAGFTIRALTNIQVLFSEPVTGVGAGDLLINGAAAADVTILAPDRYLFSFTQPPTGMVSVAWIAGHGIQDLASTPNGFLAGPSWSYVLDPNAAEPDIVITEFMAANSTGLRDEDGEFSDWIEIHNTGDVAVNLDGWRLTDEVGDKNKWRFPITNINGRAFMVIFASEKNRRTPGRPLHTNFKLSSEGEYLALIKPDGITIASEFAPTFPPQVDNVSYGLPTVSAPTVLMAPGAPLRFMIPTNNDLGLSWIAQDFIDSSWSAGTNGIGFETTPAAPSLTGAFNTDINTAMRNRSPSAYARIPFVLSDPSPLDVLTLRMKYDDGFVAYLNDQEVTRRNAPKTLANSVSEFSGTQGSNNWYYGYYNKTADADGVYQASNFALFPRNPGAFSATNYWTGTIWNWFAGDPPWTEISDTGGHPNGSNNAVQHWAIRRWVAERDGTMTVHFRLAKSNVNGGNGVTGRIFHNGLEKFSRTIAFNDAGTLTNDVVLTAVLVGDFIDIALDPTGTDLNPDDGADGSIFTAVIDQEPGLTLEWNSVATGSRPDDQATVFQDIDISPFRLGLHAGTNWLAIHGLNITAADGDFLAAAQIEGRTQEIQFDQARYFATPTPGGNNGAGVDNLGPIISATEHFPNEPLDNEDLRVTARISPTFAPVGSVTLRYRVMFGPTNAVPMLDDGLNGDGPAGDGVYGAKIPANLSVPGQMVRWYITTSDTQGRPTRFPPFESPLNSPEYLGTIVFLPQTNYLPVLHMFILNPLAANNATGSRCSLHFDGEFYDNLGINLHGQSSSGFGVDKKSYDIDFHPGYNFRWKDGEPRVDDINLVTTYADKAKMRNVLPYDTYRDAGGSAYHFVQPVRVQQNGTFFAIYDMLENGDDKFLERLGKDPNGSLYKMYSTFQVIANTTIGSGIAEKKTRRQEGNADLVTLFTAVTNVIQVRTNFMYDSMNIPATIDFLAARMLTGDVDCCHKNYYFYRDSDGTGEWEGMPWDVDLSFGRNWNSTEAYFDNAMWPANGLGVGGNNPAFSLFISDYAPARQMYLRRIRTLVDKLLQPTNTPPAELKYEKRIDELFTMIDPDNQLDLAKWGTWRDVTTGGGNTAGTPTFDTNHVDYETLGESVARLKQYLIDRRISIYSRVPGELPTAQPTNTIITFGALEFSPANGNQAQEYLELRNTNNYAVDISGWTLSGGIDYTFRGGVVIPAGANLYVSPDVKAFRARTLSPRSGQGRFVQGNYQGQLSARGEALVLTDDRGRPVMTNDYIGTPSLPQRYLRVTEIMYHPPRAPEGSPYGTEDFEYLELKNIGPSTISLLGVYFTNGLDFRFTFTNAVTALASGQTALLVRNVAAFTSRYGGGFTIAGQYGGQLDNGGETFQLYDGANEKILDITYNNSWYPTTDGAGFSLVIVNENAPFDTWDRKESWRPSGSDTGSPGGGDSALPTVATIIVNEVFTHSDPAPPYDFIELHNPNTNDVNIGGWFISDDFTEPKKYRIPNGTIIAAGGYIAFDETQFNANTNLPTSFSFSSKGDEAYVFSGDGTNLTGFFHGYEFGAAENGVSFGRYFTSTGAVHFVAQAARTPAATNSLPKVGPIVISEIMYHPPDLRGGVDDRDAEYIELRNITASDVPLFEYANPWRIRGGVDFDFPASAMVPASGYAVVVAFHPLDPARASSFRSRHGLPANFPLYGPYVGKLDNSSDRVELQRPDSPDGNDIPYILVDEVEYSDVTPWPAIVADGIGASLQRIDATKYGNDFINWTGVVPTPSAAYPGGGLPVIVRQPTNTVSVAGLDASFTIEAQSASPLAYQWFYRTQTGDQLLSGATGPTLFLEGVTPADSGVYWAVVFNGGGFVNSSTNATLTVLLPVSITAQPTNPPIFLASTNAANYGTDARAAGAPNISNAVFSVAATSTRPISYQWYFNGNLIPGANNATLIVSNVSLSHNGQYHCALADDVSYAVSTPATLKVSVAPFVLHPNLYGRPPLPITALQGENVTFDLIHGGTPPFGYRWRLNSVAITTTNGGYTYTPSLTVLNVQPSATPRSYSVVITNLANSAPGHLAPPTGFPAALLTVYADFDHDGAGDAWEVQYGFQTNNITDGGLDSDGDGLTNAEEFRAGTNPNDPLSNLKVEQFTAGGPATLRFMAISNKTYNVQFTDDLSSGDWSNFAEIIIRTTNRMETVIDPSPPSAVHRYYRVVTPLRDP